MKHTLSKITFIVLLSGIAAISCSKKDKPDLDNATIMDNANSQSLFDDALKVCEDILTRSSVAKMQADCLKTITCATIDSIKYVPDSILFIVNFSNTCIGYDGKVRSGKLHVFLKGGNFRTPGAILTIKSLGYTVNGIKVNGMKKVTCITGGSTPVHNIVVSDTSTGSGYAIITYPDGKTAQWKSSRTRTLISGGGNGDIRDNIYETSATAGIGNPAAEGINKEGRHYLLNIVNPLWIDFSCFANNTARYPTQGTLELLPDGKVSRSIDYGTGQCDNEARVTVGGKSYNVRLTY